MKFSANMIDSMNYGGISFSGVSPEIYGLSSQKHLGSKHANFPSQILESTQGFDSTRQIQKNVWTLHGPAAQEQTLFAEAIAGSIYELPYDKNIHSKCDLLDFEGQKRRSYDFFLNMFKIDDRFNPEKKLGYAISEISNESFWVHSSPINRTEDSIISYKQQDTIERILKDFLKKSSVVSSKLDLRIQKDEISKQFDVVKEWKESWSEHGLEKPTDLTITHAENVIETLLNLIISAKYRWINPFISGDGDGNVTSIWYQGKRELHLKIGEDDVEYFKVWGININTEMEVDSLEFEYYLDLWKWLINE